MNRTSEEKNAGLKRAGDLLLQGWRMLPNTCPLCTTPLMFNNKSEECRCPGCDMPVMTESAAQSANIQYAASSASTSSPQAESKCSSNNSGNRSPDKSKNDSAMGFESLEEMKAEYDRKQKARESVSSKLGDRMLSGWTLLGTTCEKEACKGTPLMSQASEPKKLLCVCCDEIFVESNSGELVSQSASKPTGAMHTTTITATKPVTVSPDTKPQSKNLYGYADTLPESKQANAKEKEAKPPTPMGARYNLDDAPILNFGRQKEEDDPSSKIGTKLLAGWALLDSVCDKDSCSAKAAVPLVRDKQGREMCVVCGYVDEEEATTMIKKLPTKVTTAHKSSRNDSYDDIDDDEEEEDADMLIDVPESVMKSYMEERINAMKGSTNASRDGDAALKEPSSTRTSTILNTSAPSTNNRPATTNPNDNSTSNSSTRRSEALTAVGQSGVDVKTILQDKISRTAIELMKCTHTQKGRDLADLITSLAHALKALNDI